MPEMLTSGELIGRITTDLADNNAGEISAEDVRGNMEDIVFSISSIVASGDTDIKYPFYNDVRLAHIAGTGGTLYAESGIVFPNWTSNPTALQIQPFLGVEGLQHNDLGGLTTGDPHSQYLNVSGHLAASNHMIGNLEMGNEWIGASGNNHTGFKFAPNGDGTETILTSGTLQFDDNSKINSGFGVAKAWLNFDASGETTPHDPVINAWHNISGIQKHDVGKFTITFNSGVFANNSYVAVGASNATTSSGSREDMDVNTVACVLREGDDGSALRTCSFVIQNDAGEYVDAKMNDFVAYGYSPGANSGTPPTVTV